MELYQQLMKLITESLLRLATLMYSGEEQIMEFWRESCAKCLAFVAPGKYGTPLQNQFARLTRQVSVIFPLFREVDGELEVLLRLRKPDEPAYPNLYCLEANVCFVYEIEEAVIFRMLQKLGVSATKIIHLGSADFSVREERGCEWKHVVFHVDFDGEPSLSDGRVWRNVKDLPEMVPHHRDGALIPALAFRKNRELFEAGEYMSRLALGQEGFDAQGFAADQNRAKLAAAEALDLIVPRTPMGTRFYDSFTPHATNISAEGVVFRTLPDDTIEVRLEQRPEGDKYFSLKWAGLGVGLRPSDSGRQSALDRLVPKEFRVPTRFKYVGDVYVTEEPRGWYECKVFLAFPEGEPVNGEWFAIDKLPENMVACHRDQIIPFALAAYMKEGK